MSIKLTFGNNCNVHYQARIRDDLPKEIREKARWILLGERDWFYIIHTEGKPRSIKYINDSWYRIGWSVDAQRYFTNSSQRIEHLEQCGLGTKTAPILSEVDQKRLQGVPSIEETHDGQEEGLSTRIGGLLDQEAFNQILHGNTKDQPVGDTHTNNELSTLIGKVKMTTTETMTKATQQLVKAHIRGGGPIDENPIRPSPAIVSEVRTLQGQNLYSQGNLTRTDNVRSPQRTFRSRNPGGEPSKGGPPRGGPPERAPRRDPPGGDPPGGEPVRGGDQDNDDC